jgi:hypothetical protein
MLGKAMDRSAEIRQLEQRIAELRARLPKHSPPPSMLIDLDELEDTLATLRKKEKDADKP